VCVACSPVNLYSSPPSPLIRPNTYIDTQYSLASKVVLQPVRGAGYEPEIELHASAYGNMISEPMEAPFDLTWGRLTSHLGLFIFPQAFAPTPLPSRSGSIHLKSEWE
jgi:hypothetical protein